MIDLTTLSAKLLNIIEEFYLWSNYWIKLDDDRYIPPDDYDFTKFIICRRNQALEIQKQIADN
jgi:hypothetical protein